MSLRLSCAASVSKLDQKSSGSESSTSGFVSSGSSSRVPKNVANAISSCETEEVSGASTGAEVSCETAAFRSKAAKSAVNSSETPENA